MMTTDPYRAYNFKLKINDRTEGHFTECSGLSVIVDSEPYREAGSNPTARKLPGPANYAPATLRYGITESRELWDWLMAAVEGNIERKNVSIILLDSTGKNEVMRWNLRDAWPSEWQGAGLNTSDRAIAIDSLTLVFDQLERS